MVKSQQVTAEELQSKIQEAKDNGERILAIGPSSMSRPKKGWTVTSYTLVTME